MTPFSHPRLAELAAHADAIRAQLADVVSAHRAALPARRGDGEWSGAQIVQHLGKTEGATAKMLEGLFARAIESGMPAESSRSSVLGALDRFKAAAGELPRLVAPERLRPDDAPDPEACWASLVAVRGRTYRAYAAVDGRALSVVTAPHPFLGPLDGYEWLLFLARHEQRHLGQLRRVLGIA